MTLSISDAKALEHSGRWISRRQRLHFQYNGYMVIRNVIPGELAAKAVGEITSFLGADLADSATWYGGAPELDGMVPLHHAQALWDIRQHPDLYEVFAEFFRNRRLMVDINRCIFRPPIRDGLTVSYGNLHWDTDPRAPGPGSLQAVVLLTDVRQHGGGFQCLPALYRNLNVWLQQHGSQDNFDFFYPNLNQSSTTQIEGKAGDVILWSSKLPHGSATNSSSWPRIAAFVTMQPASDDAKVRELMKSWWLTKRAPDYWRGLPGQLDPEPGPPAALSGLGLKLIGILPC